MRKAGMTGGLMGGQRWEGVFGCTLPLQSLRCTGVEIEGGGGEVREG